MASGDSPKRSGNSPTRKGGESPLRARKAGKDVTPMQKAKDAPKPVVGDGIQVERTLKTRRVDDFSSGCVDLVTDRFKSKIFAIFVIILFPITLLGVLVVTRVSFVPDKWLDQIPARIAILAAPTDMVLGVKSKARGISLKVMAANRDNLPVFNSQVEISLVSMVPMIEFDFCSDITAGSLRDERLGAVCKPLLFGNKVDTDLSGIAVFDEFSIIAGVPGTYVLNVTVSKVQDFVDEFGRQGNGALIGGHAWFQVTVHRNLNISITPTTRPPRAIEYATVFTGKGTVCVSPADGGPAACSQGDRNDLQSPAASILYKGGDDLANMTTVTFFAIANFSEVLMNKVEFPLASNPHMAGSVERMVRMTSTASVDPTKPWQLQDTITGYDGRVGISASIEGDSLGGSVKFPGFSVLGANNPSLFFAFYCSGVFGVWNENWIYAFPGNAETGKDPEDIWQVVEMTMLPRRDAKGLRAGEGEWWIGGQAPGNIGDDGVAAGDQAYLFQLEVVDQPSDVLENKEFTLTVNTFAFIYPRSRKRYSFVTNVYIFAEAVPVFGIDAANPQDFQKRRKVLINAISSPSTEDNTQFSKLKFSLQGDEGRYRIRFFAEGRWLYDSNPITVTTRVNFVLVRLPASVQLEWPGCNNFMTLPPKDKNFDGNPDSNFPKGVEMSMCYITQPFVPLTNLPYVEAYACVTTAQPDGSNVEFNILSLPQSCNIVQGKRLKVTVNSAPYDPFSNDEYGVRQWTWPKQKDDLTKTRDVTELPAVSYQQKFPVIYPRHELSSLTVNHMMKESMFLSFSVGGVASPMKIAVAMNDTSALRLALDNCMGDFVPVAYLEILDDKEVDTKAPDPQNTVYPGISTFQRRVFAADMYGRPAKKRPICLRTFALDWQDYFADRVKLHDDLRQVRTQNTRDLGTTLENFTYFNSTCWLTNNMGIATVNLFWDHRDVKFRQGSFAWYFETEEWKDGAIYRKMGTRWFPAEPIEENSWTGRQKERECLASFGFHVPNVRTESYYVYITQGWSRSPTAVFSTARMPQLLPQDGISFFPQRGTHYGTLDRRTVEANRPHNIYVRLYQGSASADFAEGSDGLYPKGIVMSAYFISGPPNFPKNMQQCFGNDDPNTNECYDVREVSLTGQAAHQSRSDDFGYGSFTFKATQKYLGVFRIVIAVGESQSGAFSGLCVGANEFSQIFEIEVVPFRELPTCRNIPETPLIPSLKYFHTCPFRNPDGLCSWGTSLCPTSGTGALLTLNDNFLGSPQPECIPLGTKFPAPLSAQVQNDKGEPVAGISLYLYGGFGSNSLKLHPTTSQPSNAAGVAIANTVVLDYAEPGLHRLYFKMQLDSLSFITSTSESQQFMVKDEIIAAFVQQPPAFVVIGHVIEPAIAVKLSIKRKCSTSVAAGPGHHDWQPPWLVLHASLAIESSENSTTNRSRWDAGSSIILSGVQAVPTFTPENVYFQIATATFSNLKILSGMAATYRFHVTVLGSDRVLASSLPITLLRYATMLQLIDRVPKNTNSDTTLMLRVKASSKNGSPVAGAFLTVRIEPRHIEDGLNAGRRDDQNVSAVLDLDLSRAVTGNDGIATFSIVFRTFTYPGMYVLRFMHSGSPDIFSQSFNIVPPIKELEMISNPGVDYSYKPELVWWELQAGGFKVPVGFMAPKIPVQESPANMKGSIKGEDIDDNQGPVVKLKDHRGFGVIGLSFNVTLVDPNDDILNEVVSAKRGDLLMTDWGLSKDVEICAANKSRYDCNGLYGFEALATGNRLKSGFYRIRFESNGISIVQGIDLLFMNEYMPNILRLRYYMYLSLGVSGANLLLFQFNRLDKLIFQRFTGKYQQTPGVRVLLGLLGTIATGVFGWFSYLFYNTMLQSKGPPHVLDGKVFLTDLTAYYTQMIVYITILACCLYSFWSMTRIDILDIFDISNNYQRRESSRERAPETFLKKIGMNAKVADLRRNFVGKTRKHIEKPPKLVANRGKMAIKLQKFNEMVREKVLKTLFEYGSRAIQFVRLLYVRVKYSSPAFRSIYYAYPDIFFGVRFRSALILNTFLLILASFIGLWFGDMFASILTTYYGIYIGYVLDNGRNGDIDWFKEIWTTGALGTLQQVLVLFHARTSKLGQPFFWDLLTAFRDTSFFATVLSATIILCRIVIMAREQRATICNLRLGKIQKEVGNVKKLSLIEGSAYMGNQAVLMLFGWVTFYVFAYSTCFMLAWNNTRRVLMMLTLPLIITSFFMYFCFNALARLRVLRNPGLVVSGRGQFALAEFLLLFVNFFLGPFTAFARFSMAVTRTVMTWFLLHNKLHEIDEESGLGNSMYKAAIYVHHVHNNPVTRALVERLHDQLRNMDTMRRFPPDNIEPAKLKKETAEHRARKLQKRIIARLLLLLLMQANEHVHLRTFRKQHMHLYQRRLRKGIFYMGTDGAGDEADSTKDETEKLALELGVGPGITESNELLSMEEAEDDAPEEEGERRERDANDDDDDDPDSSRWLQLETPTNRSVGALASKGKGLFGGKKKGGDGPGGGGGAAEADHDED